MRHCITKTCLCNIQRFFSAVKKENSIRKFLIYIFSYFCSKHRLWVHVSTHNLCFGAKIRKINIPTSTHNLCFGAKIRKINIPLQTPVFYIKVGFEGYTLHGHVFLVAFFIQTQTRAFIQTKQQLQIVRAKFG